MIVGLQLTHSGRYSYRKPLLEGGVELYELKPGAVLDLQVQLGDLGDAELARWARSKDRWWRRAALSIVWDKVACTTSSANISGKSSPNASGPTPIPKQLARALLRQRKLPARWSRNWVRPAA